MKQRFFDIAKAISKLSKSDPQMGAVIVKKGKIIGVGCNNREKTHPKSKWFGNTVHAEHQAIMGVSLGSLSGSICYVFRETRKGQLAMARPCQACIKHLKAVGVKTICYTVVGGTLKEKLK